MSRSVLIVTREVSRRGAGLDAHRLVERLVDSDVSVRILCEEAEEPPPGIPTTVRPGLGSTWRQILGLQLPREIPENDPPGLIHVLGEDFAEAGITLSERLGLPYLLSVDEFVPPGGRLRVGTKHCRGLIAPNQELAEDLVKSMGVPPGMIRVIPPGLPVPTEPKPCGKRNGIHVVGAAGTLNAGSGFVTFLNAARRVLDTGIDAEFVVAGTGEEESELRRRAERLKIDDRVTFASESSPADGFWDVLDVYCQPSTIPTVGRGLRMAMSHAVPSIASDIPGLRSLVEHDVTGLQVVPGDTNAAAKAVTDLLRNPDRAASLGRAGRERVLRDHDAEAEIDALLALYDEAIRSD